MSHRTTVSCPEFKPDSSTGSPPQEPAPTRRRARTNAISISTPSANTNTSPLPAKPLPLVTPAQDRTQVTNASPSEIAEEVETKKQEQDEDEGFTLVHLPAVGDVLVLDEMDLERFPAYAGADALFQHLAAHPPSSPFSFPVRHKTCPNKITTIFSSMIGMRVYCIDLRGTYRITCNRDVALAAMAEIKALEKEEQAKEERAKEERAK